MQSPAIQPTAPGNEPFTLTANGLPLLDAGSAMALMDNSADLYLAIADAYLQELALLPAKAEAGLLLPDLTEASRTLHTFKGLSLTLGAKYIAEVSRQCEQRLKFLLRTHQHLPEEERNRMCLALTAGVDHTRQVMEETIRSLSAPASSSQPAPTDAPVADLLLDLDSLKQLLTQSDMRALDRYAGLRARHGSLQEELAPLDRALNAFDFSQAVVQCDELISRFGSPE